MSKVYFSVLIPVYVKETPSYFNKALESITLQSLLPDEIVIVADGPLSKELDEVINIYTKQFPDIFNIIRLPKNMGMGVAMNTGLKNCKYEWVARMDSDDIARTNRFEKQIKYIEEHPEIDVLGSFAEEFISEIGDFAKIRVLPTSHQDILRFTKKRCPINHMTVMYRRTKAIEAGGYWENRIFEDYNLWYEMLKRSCRFANLPNVLIDVRVGNNMVDRRRGLSYFRQEFNFFKQMRNEGFINVINFITVVSVRFISRILPKFILEKIYYLLLRR